MLLCGITILGFSQSKYLDSLYHAYETQEGESSYKNLYRYIFSTMAIDQEKSISLITKARTEIKASDLPNSTKAYLLGLYCEVEANMEMNNGNNKKSIELFQKCLSYSQEAEGEKKHLLEATAYWGKGIHFGTQGLFEQSNNELLLARIAFVKANQPGRVADTYAQMGQNFTQLQEYDSTIHYMNKALSLIDTKLDKSNQYYYNFFKANAFNDMNKPDSTIALLGNGYLDQATNVSPILVGHLAFSLADAFAVKKQIKSARKYLAQGKEIVDNTDERQLRQNYLYCRLKLEKAAENYKAAFFALEDYKVYEDSLYKNQLDQQFMNLQSKYDAQRKDFQIKTLESEARYNRNLIGAGGGFFLLLLLSGFLWLRNISQKKNTAEALAAKEMEVMETKERLFTNITHELRTPLSLIINPLRELESQQISKKLQTKARLALDNSQQLKNLVDQILDWHSLDSNMLKNTPSIGEVNQILNQSILRFKSAAESKQINLISDFPKEEINGLLDFDKLEKIVNNLISNAIKYSPDGKNVNVKALLQSDQLHIQITDQGPGIPIDKQKEIFNRYERGDTVNGINGSGLGLSIVKELVELMDGSVELKSNAISGSNISVIIPFEKINKPKNKKRAKVFPINNSNTEKPVLFLVEDNRELQKYVSGELESEYHVERFLSAEAAENALKENLPDIMILDVMLPGMDGITFCEKLKSNVNTNHIPILILSAKPISPTKIEALQVGADVWMSKPFEFLQLQIQLRNLIESRRILQQKYNHQITFGFGKEQIEIQDDFLQKLSDFILENLSNEQLAVDDLVKASGMNRSTMSKKLKAMTNKTPVQFIKNIRLEKAKSLLLKKGKNVSEVAFEVGFKDPNYFSSSFSDHFGFPPSDIKKKMQRQ